MTRIPDYVPIPGEGAFEPDEYRAKVLGAPDEANLQPVDLSGFVSSPSPAPAYVIRGLVPRRVVTLLGGHGGAGKSFIGLTLAAHVAGCERTWSGFTVELGEALYVSLEDPGDVVRHRLGKIATAYGLDAEKVERRLQVVDGTGGDASLAVEVNEHGIRRLGFTTTLAEVADHAKGKDLIVIDNASDAFAANENERRQVRAFMRELAGIAADNNAGLILLAHIDKAAARYGSAGNSYSGSTAWHNSARSRLALVIDDDDDVMLVPEKLNHGKPADPVALAWSDNGVLVPAIATKAGAEAADADHVLAALRAAQAASVDVGAGRTGPSTAQAVLSTFDELPKHLRGAKGRGPFWAAVNKLQADGKIKVVEIVTGQRKRKRVIRANSKGEEDARAISPHPYALIGAHGVRGLCADSAPIEPAQTGADDYRRAKGGE